MNVLVLPMARVARTVASIKEEFYVICLKIFFF